MDEWKAWRESIAELAKGNGPGPKTVAYAIEFRRSVDFRAAADPLPADESNQPWEPPSWLTPEQIQALERQSSLNDAIAARDAGEDDAFG